MPLTCSDDDPDVFEVLRRAGIKLDDAPREVFAPDVLRRAGEDDVDPRVTRAVDALTARLFPEAEDGKEPSWWRPDQSFWICEPTKPKQSEEETEDMPAHKRVPFDDDDPADDWHKRVGAALRDLAALRDSHTREDGELIFIFIWAISVLTSCFVQMLQTRLKPPFNGCSARARWSSRGTAASSRKASSASRHPRWARTSYAGGPSATTTNSTPSTTRTWPTWVSFFLFPYLF